MKPTLYIGEAELYSEVAPIEPDILSLDARFIVGSATDHQSVQSWSDLFIETDGTPIPRPHDAHIPAVLLTTSGTTGHPKFVTHTAETLSAMMNTWPNLEMNSQKIAVVATPMVHASGFMTCLGCIQHGVRMVLLERFAPDAVLDAIETHHCNWMLGLAFMYHGMIERQRARTRKVGSLLHCFAGGDVMPVSLQREFEEEFGIPLRNWWAATETIGSLTYGLRPGAVCRIAPGAEVRLVNAENQDVHEGEAGELLLRGPNVTPGYWVAPNLVEDGKPDGWFHTGDLMRRGEGDELWFVGRCKDLIIRGGSNIAPLEVETALLENPMVRGAAIVGVPDPLLGARVAGLVQLQPGSGSGTLESIMDDLRTRIADYKLPEWLIMVQSRFPEIRWAR